MRNYNISLIKTAMEKKRNYREILHSAQQKEVPWQALSEENAHTTAMEIKRMFEGKQIHYSRVDEATGRTDWDNMLSVVPGSAVETIIQFDTEEAVYPHWIAVGFKRSDDDTPHYIRLNKKQQFLIDGQGEPPCLVNMVWFYPNYNEAMRAATTGDRSSGAWKYEIHEAIEP